MTMLMETKSQIVRSLPTLVPLIKEELNLAKIAAKEASLPHFRKVGEYLQEAREQLPKDEQWGTWLKTNFTLSKSTAYNYMNLAHDHEIREALSDQGDTSFQRAGNSQPRVFKTLSEFVTPDRHPGHRPAWHHKVLDAVEHVDIRRLTQDRMEKEKELRLVRGLARQIIDIGFKVLATKLHPDKTGGSREAMQRLNQAKDLLKQAIL